MSEPGMGPYPPWVSLALRAPVNQRSARGIGVSRPCGAVSTRVNSISCLPGCRSCRYMGRCLKRGCGPIFLGLPSLYAPQPTSDRPVRLGFPHRAGRCRCGRTPLSSPRCRSCRDMEACLIRGCEPVLTVFPLLYAPLSISDRPVVLGFPHSAGRCRLGIT